MFHLDRFRNSLFAVIATVCFANAAPAYAQADEAVVEPPPGATSGEASHRTPAWGANRKLKSTTMLSPMFCPRRWYCPILGLRTGIERAETDHVPFSPRTVDLKLIRIAEGIDGGIRIIDRVGLFVNLSGFGVTSTNQESLIVRGGSYRLNAGGGVIVKLFQLKQPGTQFSLRARAAGGNGKIYNLLPLLRQLDATPVRSAVSAARGNSATCCSRRSRRSAGAATC